MGKEDYGLKNLDKIAMFFDNSGISDSIPSQNRRKEDVGFGESYSFGMLKITFISICFANILVEKFNLTFSFFDLRFSTNMSIA